MAEMCTAYTLNVWLEIKEENEWIVNTLDIPQRNNLVQTLKLNWGIWLEHIYIECFKEINKLLR